MIDSINGKVLQDIDPRIILGGIIAQAEATDGVISLRVRDKKGKEPYDVVVKIPVLGAYGETWPMRDEKSDRIVRGLAEYLKTSGADGMGTGFGESLRIDALWYRALLALPPSCYYGEACRAEPKR